VGTVHELMPTSKTPLSFQLSSACTNYLAIEVSIEFIIMLEYSNSLQIRVWKFRVMLEVTRGQVDNENNNQGQIFKHVKYIQS